MQDIIEYIPYHITYRNIILYKYYILYVANLANFKLHLTCKWFLVTCLSNHYEKTKSRTMKGVTKSLFIYTISDEIYDKLFIFHHYFVT